MLRDEERKLKTDMVVTYIQKEEKKIIHFQETKKIIGSQAPKIAN